MKISVRTTHYTNSNSPQLRGYATVKFDDSYVLESVKIMERQDSNEIFIALPSLMVRTKDQNGNYVINDKGEYVKKTSGYEYVEFFHPVKAETYNELRDSVVNGLNYTRNMKKMNSYDNSRGQDEVLDMTGESRGLGR